MESADELIQTLDKVYFENEENFNIDHVTDKLPAKLTGEFLQEYKGRLEKLLSVVTRKVSELILSHQPTYVDELQRIANLQESITESIRVCTQGRSCLRFIKDGTVKNGSTIIEHYRKRESLAKLLDSLIAISDLRRSVIEICSLIDSQEDFPKAIQMCIDGKALLTSFQKYKCVNGLEAKLDDTIELIGEQVDIVLSKMCLSYNPNTFAMLQQSYALMDKCINTQALTIFNAYHKSSMDELRAFLENEPWDMVPVKNDFKLVQLKEFSFLRPANLKQTTVNNSTDQISTESNFSTGSLFYGDQEPIPLDKISLSSDSDDDEDLDAELNKNFVEEDDFISSESGSRYLLTKKSGPVLTNSSLNVLRLIGRYIQMMSILEPISYEILMRIYNLLDYYITVVYKKFGPDSDKKGEDKNISPKLKIVIRSIRESLIGQSASEESNPQTKPSGETNMIIQQGAPNIANIITHDLSPGHSRSDESINPKKAVAIESLIFLVNQLWNLQEYLESLIPAELRPQLREQFSQSHPTIVPDFLKARAEMPI